MHQFSSTINRSTAIFIVNHRCLLVGSSYRNLRSERPIHSNALYRCYSVQCYSSTSVTCTLINVHLSRLPVSIYQLRSILRIRISLESYVLIGMPFILPLLLILQCSCLSGAFFSTSLNRMRRSVMVMRSIVPDKGLQSAWQLARRSEIRMPCVILVSPYVDGNVGSVSRCMLNWGLSELRIG